MGCWVATGRVRQELTGVAPAVSVLKRNSRRAIGVFVGLVFPNVENHRVNVKVLEYLFGMTNRLQRKRRVKDDIVIGQSSGPTLTCKKCQPLQNIGKLEVSLCGLPRLG